MHIKIPLYFNKRMPFKLLIYLFFIYASIYGTLSIFIDNIVVRALKDGVLSFFIVLSSFSILLKNTTKTQQTLFLAVMGFIVVSIISSFNHGFIVLFVYGFKITVLPILAVFFGSYLKRKEIEIKKPLILIYFIIIIAWIIQYILGIDKLLEMGFEYGKNVSHFVNGQLRLPSMNGAPDSYAFLLAITGILIEVNLSYANKQKLAAFIKVITFVLLLLATIRSPLVLWLIYQTLQYTNRIKFVKKRIAYIGISMMSFILALVPILVNVFTNSAISDTSSFKMRLLRWGTHFPKLNELEGFIGFGLGTLGAASQRAYDLGFQTFDFATDNQFLAIYGQTGFIGLLCFLSFLLIILLSLRKKIKSTEGNERIKPLAAYYLLLGTLVSCFFTNSLEIYPFNIFLWTFIGMELTNKQLK
ncbi:hypothetical protein IB49_09110 [Geobacillus sp. LC300]|nr:hypothetical protein IB49_09110 [Geobacillus sp. LC300]